MQPWAKMPVPALPPNRCQHRQYPPCRQQAKRAESSSCRRLIARQAPARRAKMRRVVLISSTDPEWSFAAGALFACRRSALLPAANPAAKQKLDSSSDERVQVLQRRRQSGMEARASVLPGAIDCKRADDTPILFRRQHCQGQMTRQQAMLK